MPHKGKRGARKGAAKPRYARKVTSSLPVAGGSHDDVFVFDNRYEKRDASTLSHCEWPQITETETGLEATVATWFERRRRGEYFVLPFPGLAESSMPFVHFVQRRCRENPEDPRIAPVAAYLEQNTIKWEVDCAKGSIVEAINGSAATMRNPVHKVLNVETYSKVLSFVDDNCSAYECAPIDLENSTESKLAVMLWQKGWLTKRDTRVIHNTLESKLKGESGLIWKIKAECSPNIRARINPTDTALKVFAKERIRVRLADKMKAGITIQKGQKHLEVKSGVDLTPAETQHMGHWLRGRVPELAGDWQSLFEKKKWCVPLSVAQATAIFGRTNLRKHWERCADIAEPFKVHIGEPIILSYDKKRGYLSVKGTCYLNTIRRLREVRERHHR